MPTVHNEAQVGEIAKVVLMPGDPLRAKFVAENFLKNPKLVNKVRNIFCYTGEYKGVKVSIMASGMGIPSMAIYSHELFTHYGVEKIIRFGTCGAFQPHIKVGDIIIAKTVKTNSNFAKSLGLKNRKKISASTPLLDKAVDLVNKLGYDHHVGNIFTSDIFYHQKADWWKKWAKRGLLAVEMESLALYVNAFLLNAQGLTILTVSDHLLTHESTSSEERQNSFQKMMHLALEVAIKE